MSESEQRQSARRASYDGRKRRQRELQKRKRLVGLILQLVMVIVLVGISFYIGTKVGGASGNAKEANNGIVESSSAADEELTTTEPVTEEPETTIEVHVTTIVVDPGHGGTQPGAVITDSDGEEICEKDINLAIALYLEEMLTEAGYKVIMTRDDDSKVSLEERVQICNESDADLFVSIHQNILENDEVTHGVETWYWTGSTEGYSLAACVQDGVVTASGAKSIGVKETDDLYVLHYTEVPSVLVETGFLSCPGELTSLLDSSYQQALADGIFNGIVKYLE